MTHALNLTLPLKQDAESQAKLKQLEAIFTDQVQPKIEEALKKSKLVHFARVVVIDNKYIQVITEYEGDHQEYTEFFRRELTPVFGAIFGLAEGAPSSADSVAFWEYSKANNRRSLGQDTTGALDFSGNPAGWLFSAYDHKDVRTIQAALDKAGA
ncbi:MAG: hypothetical protein ABWZ83_01430 [Mesorhizobium sp.]